MIPDKIKLDEIFLAHLASLRVGSAKIISRSDLVLFFVIPIASALLFAYIIHVDGSGYLNTIIAVYAIFSALLINAQVAMYTIFRSWPKVAEQAPAAKRTKNQSLRERRDANSRTLVREVNANLSYLTIVSAFALVLSFTFSIICVRSSIELFVSIFLLIHFFLTLLMVVKRIHRLFDTEFQD